HPAEYTNKMFFEAALKMIGLLKILVKNGYALKDAHPLNITNFKGRYYFFDFTSIYKSGNISLAWLEEFYKYFAIPIYLASKEKTYKLSKEYRREHKMGLGLNLAETKLVKKIFFRDFWALTKYTNNP